MTERIQLEPETPAPRVQIRCGGDLVVEGWERPLIEVDGRGSQPLVDAAPGRVEIAADSSCTVRLPRIAKLVEIAAEGQIKVSELNGGLTLPEAKGDLHLDGVGSVNVGSAEGRVMLASIAGDVQVRERAKADFSAQKVGGKIAIAEVTGRLSLQDVSSVKVKRALGDVSVQNAGGNVVVGRVDGVVRFENVAGAAALEKGLGDVYLRGVRGNIACDETGGQMHLADVGEVAVRQVNGDLTAEEVHGSLACHGAKGRATLRAVGGSVSIGGVGGDLVAEGCGGALSANCGGSAILSGIVGEVRVNAGGNIRCRFESNAGGSVKAVCGGSLRVEGGPTPVARGAGVHTFRVGALKNSYTLVAGGSVHIESEAKLAGLGDDLGVRGARIAARAQRRAVRSLGKTIRRNLRAAGKKAAEGSWADARSWSFHFDTDSPAPDAAKRERQLHSQFDDFEIDVDIDVETDFDVDLGADFDSESESESEPVTEEERLTVLRMLSEGKITAAEAEQLLDALGSQDLRHNAALELLLADSWHNRAGWKSPLRLRAPRLESAR